MVPESYRKELRERLMGKSFAKKDLSEQAAPTRKAVKEAFSYWKGKAEPNMTSKAGENPLGFSWGSKVGHPDVSIMETGPKELHETKLFKNKVSADEKKAEALNEGLVEVTKKYTVI